MVSGQHPDSLLANNPEMVKKYRGSAALFNYLGQDRADVAFAAKELSRAMAAPTEADVVALKRAATAKHNSFYTSDRSPWFCCLRVRLIRHEGVEDLAMYYCCGLGIGSMNL